MSRREARETAMRMLYKEAINKSEEPEDLSLELAKYIDEDNGIFLTDKDNQFVDEILKGVEEQQEEIDKLITSLAKGWKLSRLPLVDLSVLRLAIFEIMYREDIPDSVSINESVELAKKYCGETSAPFINGLLGQVTKKKENTERTDNE